MTLRKLPEIALPAMNAALAFEPGVPAIDRWNVAMRPARAQAGTVIDIYDVIGFDWLTGQGITAKSITAALKGAGDVTVNINSPGGNFFEGIAIYNILRNHSGRVDVNIMSLAASAASVIAMAGDTIRIGRAAMIMIHNAWGMVIGNKLDMQKAAADFAVFDDLMAGLYSARTGKPRDEIAAMMDAETFLDGESAVADKFADGLLAADEVEEDAQAAAAAKPMAARRRVDAILAERGMSRSERRALIKDLKNSSGTPGAAADAEVKPGADFTPLAAALARLNSILS